jgi:hypothetical protein
VRLIHRLIRMRYGISEDSALNSDGGRGQELVPVALNRCVIALKAEAFDPGSGRVDYARLRHSPAYADYRGCTARLTTWDPAGLAGEAERLAFWVNLYNALIIDAVIRFGVRHSIRETPGFFWRAAYDVGGNRYDANDIEHGILRANRGHPAIPGAHFRSSDPRLAHSLQRLDPRVHFALVCAARSCPPIAVYAPGDIDAQLELAARAFIQGGGAVVTRREVGLSRIFGWYAPDFGGGPFGLGDKTPLLSYIAPYLSEADGRELARHARPRVRFAPYDWSLNQ